MTTLRISVMPLRFEWCEDCLADSVVVVEVLTASGVSVSRNCWRCADKADS